MKYIPGEPLDADIYATLKFLNVEKARTLFYPSANNETILANLHHQRLTLWYLFTRKERRESWVFLTGNGYALPASWRIREEKKVQH